MTLSLEMIERDFYPFADPATEMAVTSGPEHIRVELVRNSHDYVLNLRIVDGRTRLQIRAEDGMPLNREFKTVKSLLASEHFSDIQKIADNQKRIYSGYIGKSFIEPEGTINDEALSLELFEDISKIGARFDDGKPINLILLDGSAGVGKTSLISRMVAERATQYGRESAQPPILHVVNRGRRLVSLDELMALSIHLVRGNFTYDQVPALIRNGVIQIAIDGFDELVDAEGYTDTWAVLREFLNDISEGGPIILAGRDTFFDLTKFNEGLREVRHRVQINHVSLSAVTPHAAKTWLQTRGWTNEDLSSEQANDLLKRGSYALRPYFLNTIAEMKDIKNLLLELNSPRDFLVRSFLRREAKLITQRVKLSEDDAAKLLHELFELLALEMAEAETESVDIPFLQLAIDAVFADKLTDPSDLSKLRHKAGSFALMDQDARADLRRFPHTEISNHFLASALIKQILDERPSRFLRRGYFGTDLLSIVGDQVILLSAQKLRTFRDNLLSLSRATLGAERLNENAASLLLTSLVANISGDIELSNLSTGDIVLFGFTSNAKLNSVSINRADCRGADLSPIDFVDTQIACLVADTQTQFGQCAPVINTLMIENGGRTTTIYDPREICEWINTHRSQSSWVRTHNKSTQLLEKVCRVFLRQFFIKANDYDSASYYLSDQLWPEIEDILEKNNRIRRTDRKDASGRPGEFIHVVNATSLLEALTDEDKNIWQKVAALRQPDA